ncbi:MAG: hypothetical protein HY290_01370 [Planctomycetia bacterium]|nr:hypothetical protein [Planctomycetia bacterium]
MNGSPLAVRKLIVGLISLGCLLTAAGMWFLVDDPITNPAVSISTRLGLMLGALWLALPRDGENIAWQKVLPAIVAVIAVLAFFRVNWRILLFLLPIAIVVAVVATLIRPRSKRRPPK